METARSPYVPIWLDVAKERFDWLTRYRRLVRDYERRLDVSEALIYLAMGGLIVRRICHPRHSQTDSYNLDRGLLARGVCEFLGMRDTQRCAKPCFL